MIIAKEMGYSRTEFLNQFKLFARDKDYILSGNTLEFPIDSHLDTQLNAYLLIAITELSERVIGSLKIPRLAVQFTFKNCSEQQCQAFFKRFDLSFQRGGG